MTREARGELATKADLAELRAALEKQIAEAKTDMVKWMFLFWIGQVATFFGLMKFMLPSS